MAEFTDAQLLAIADAYDENSIVGCHYTPEFVIFDTSRPAAQQELWRGPDSDRAAYEDRLKVERMRLALASVVPAPPPSEAVPDVPAAVLDREGRALARLLQDKRAGWSAWVSRPLVGERRCWLRVGNGRDEYSLQFMHGAHRARAEAAVAVYNAAPPAAGSAP